MSYVDFGQFVIINPESEHYPNVARLILTSLIHNAPEVTVEFARLGRVPVFYYFAEDLPPDSYSLHLESARASFAKSSRTENRRWIYLTSYVSTL